MSDIKIQKFPLQWLFDNKRGDSKLTKKYCNLHKGNYPVYTGTTIGDFTSIDTYTYAEPNLTYTTDGVNAGTVEIIVGQYNVGGHRAILIPKHSNLYIKYFENILQPIFKSYVKNGNVPSVTWNNIKEIGIPVPVDKNGEFSIAFQQEISQRYSNLKIRKLKFADYLMQLRESYINIPVEGYAYAEKWLKDIFEYKRGRSCTKAFCNQHQGRYPVWSANNIEPLARVDFFDYEGSYISLSRNGIAGKITVLEGKFTINEDRFLLIPKVGSIDYDFIKYTVEPILRSKKKGRAGHSGENEFTKLSFAILDGVKIQIPVKSDGSYDLEAQKEISRRYSKLYEIKKNIEERLERIISTNIMLDNLD